MVISRDEPGRSLVLHEESISFWKNGGCRMLVLVPFCMVPLVILFLVFLEPGASKRAGAWIPLAVFAIWVLGVGVAAITELRRARRLALLSADASTGEFTIEEWAPLPFFARQRSIPIDDIERIELWTVREYGKPKGADLPLWMRLDLRGRGMFDLPYTLDVHGLDRREEALDLVLRFAHVVGLGHQRVAKNDHVEFRVSVSRTPEEGSTPVPPLSGPAEYERGQVGVAGGLEEDPVPPFEPQRFPSEYTVERWEPGREVLLTRAATPGQAWADTLGCFVVLLFGAFLAWALGLAADVPIFAPGAATLAGIALFALAVQARHSRAMRGEVRVDWGARRLMIDRYGTSIDIPFDLIQRIEVRAARSEHAGSKGETAFQTFRVQVFVRLSRALRSATGVELVVETKEVRDDPIGPYRSGLALGVELARALGVPYVYRDYR